MKLKHTVDDATVELLGGAAIEVSWGDLRSACHARDLRALIEVAYRKRRYVLLRSHESYIADILPEYEREVWVWVRAMIARLLDMTNMPPEMARGFAATWAEWMCSGATDSYGMAVVLEGLDPDNPWRYQGAAAATYESGSGGDLITTHELNIIHPSKGEPFAWGVRWSRWARLEVCDE